MYALMLLTKILNLSPRLDICFNQNNQELLYLPAYRRHKGNVYKSSQIVSLFPQTTSIRDLVTSVLYGLLDANDLIRDYDLAITESLPNRTMLKTRWKRKDLGTIVEECIRDINPSKIHDLLSGHYCDALQP
jgi:cytoplasmic iron level regulating protein YaaA (DUF328/UPF0246 family)